MRAHLGLVGGVLVAAGGVACAGAWTVAILGDTSRTIDTAYVVFALGAAVLAVGASIGFGALLLPWHVKTGGIAAALLFLLGALTLLAYIGFVIAPLGVLCVAAAAHAAGGALRIGAMLLLASFAVYALGAWLLESRGHDGAYAVVVFTPVFGLAWLALGYGIVAAAARSQEGLAKQA
jgi:hypothetical protein